MDLKQVNQSIVSVILTLNDPKNFYSRNHAFSLRLHGKTMTNSTGIAFKHQRKIFVVCDGNIFAPYSKQTNLIQNHMEISVQFTDPLNAKPNKYHAQIIQVHHLDSLQSGIQSMDAQFSFGYLNHSDIHSHLKHKFGYLLLLQITECNPQLLQHVIPLNILHTASSLHHSSPSTLIGHSIFSISNPFGILCSNVLSNTVHHGILSTVLWIKHNVNEYIWLSDMRYLPGMEGAIVISNKDAYNHFIGMLSLPLMIGKHATLTTIIPSSIIVSWITQQLHHNNNIPSIISQPNVLNVDRLCSADASNKDSYTTNNTAIYNAAQCVVPICIGSHWGSAIFVYKDHILTNAHIIRPYLKHQNEDDLVKRVQLKGSSRHQSPKIGVAISDHNRKWLLCKVIYVTHSDSACDVAWLRVTESADEYKAYMQCIQLLPFQSIDEMHKDYMSIFEKRKDVFVIGYGLIHPWNALSPIVSHGVLSNVVYDKNEVVILKTSADIHAGHSGGLLCDNEGYCLGILTNNSVFDFDTNKSAMNTWEKQMLWNHKASDMKGNNDKISFVYPHLNSAIPFSVIYGLYRCIVDGAQGMNVDKRVKKVFETLDEANAIIAAKWNLVSPEKLQHELQYDKKMKSIMERIPSHLLQEKKPSKL